MKKFLIKILTIYSVSYVVALLFVIIALIIGAFINWETDIFGVICNNFFMLAKISLLIAFLFLIGILIRN